jgi:S1-C subfamily serine protease
MKAAYRTGWILMNIKTVFQVYILLLLAITCSGTALYALSGDSPLVTIERASSALVLVRAEGAGLVGGGGIAIATFANEGGGVIIHPSGIIATSAHIVRGAGRVKVAFHDATVAEARIVAVRPDIDIAILQVPVTKPLDAIPFADLSRIRLGETVYNVGTSELLRGTISEGVVAHIGTRDTPQGREFEFIGVNFGVYKGDSGGAILNRYGELVGIIAAGSATGGEVVLAVAASRIEDACRQLEAGKTPDHR